MSVQHMNFFSRFLKLGGPTHYDSKPAIFLSLSKSLDHKEKGEGFSLKATIFSKRKKQMVLSMKNKTALLKTIACIKCEEKYSK